MMLLTLNLMSKPPAATTRACAVADAVQALASLERRRPPREKLNGGISE